MKLYHKDVYMSDDMIKQSPNHYCGKLEETQHFFNRNRGLLEKYVVDEDKFQDAIDEIRHDKPTPFEVETTDDGKTVTKCCIRTNYDEYRDISIVFRDNKIITFWFNGVNDTHFTLDRSKYCKS